MKNKYTIENIIAYNGIEVVSIQSTEYKHTNGAKIISDWIENGIEYSPKGIIEQFIEYIIETIEDKIIYLIDFILYERE